MSFLPPVVGRLFKTWLTKGAHRYPRNPRPPSYAPDVQVIYKKYEQFV